MSFLEVRSVPGKGQGYVSTCVIPAGTILFRDDAISSSGFARGLKPPKAAMTELVKKFLEVHLAAGSPSDLTATQLDLPLKLESLQEGVSDEAWTAAYFQVRKLAFQ